jgi:hypothetical protein
MNVNLARQNDFATVAQAQERAVTEGPELTVVIPTLNERDNIGLLVELLDAVLDTVSWEVMFVDDDSPDGTADRIRKISRGDRRVRRRDRRVHPYGGPLVCAHHRISSWNNLFTYRDRRLRGLALLRGLFTFYAICALGTVANVGIAGYIFSRNEVWWLAGVAGVAVGSVWNYAVSSVFTWKQNKSRKWGFLIQRISVGNSPKP